jgi:hypothetical protein
MDIRRKFVNGRAGISLKFNKFDEDDRRILEYLEDLRKARGQKDFIKRAVLAYIDGQNRESELAELLINTREIKAQLASGQVVFGTPLQGEPVKIRGSDVALPAPIFEDDDVVLIRKDNAAGATAAANFLKSVIGIQDIESAPNEQTRQFTTTGRD